ncbi:MAG: right-handed parallel beta-helix repeat-containing protein, partial [Bacteroidota bacterium]|nr:right-handed parallel beta-helix repeat-containing protein [Bacteroidota bacterium]
IFYLKKYSSKDFISSFMKEVNKKQKYFENIIQQEFPAYHYDYSFLKNNAATIRKELPKFTKYVKENPDFAKFAFDISKHKKNYDTTFHKDIPDAFVNSYLEKINKKNNTSEIRIENYYTKKLHILGTGNKPSNITSYLHPSPEVSSYNKTLGKPIYIKADTLAKYLFFIVDGHNKTFASEISQHPSPKITIPEDSLIALKEFENATYLKITEKNILFTGKNIVIDTSLIIPKGYNVTIPAGTNIDITNNANILSYSTMHITGTKNNPVKITSSDKTAKGFYLLQAEKKSTFSHVEFSNLSSLDYNGWTLPGAVCIYETEIEINNATFRNNQHCDDALNIIRSNFHVSNCYFTKTFADAFDSDFCTGLIDNCTFDNIGNDAIDFSGSKIDIRNCDIASADDKGISGGEQSTLTIENCVITNCNIGVASKDLSNVSVLKSEIRNCNYAFVALRKKPEYGGAKIMARRMKLKNNSSVHLIEEESKLILGTQIVIGKEKNVRTRFY